MNDAINHPNHYVKNAIVLEPIELTGRLNSCIGQALQYVIRRKDKGSELEDLQKAVFWLNWYKENVAESVAALDDSEVCVADSECDLNEVQRVIGAFAFFSKDDFTRLFIMALFSELDAHVTIVVGGVVLSIEEAEEIKSMIDVTADNWLMYSLLDDLIDEAKGKNK